MTRLGWIVFRERLDLSAVSLASLARQEPKGSMARSGELSVRLSKEIHINHGNKRQISLQINYFTNAKATNLRNKRGCIKIQTARKLTIFTTSRNTPERKKHVEFAVLSMRRRRGFVTFDLPN